MQHDFWRAGSMDRNDMWKFYATAVAKARRVSWQAVLQPGLPYDSATVTRLSFSIRSCHLEQLGAKCVGLYCRLFQIVNEMVLQILSQQREIHVRTKQSYTLGKFSAGKHLSTAVLLPNTFFFSIQYCHRKVPITGPFAKPQTKTSPALRKKKKKLFDVDPHRSWHCVTKWYFPRREHNFLHTYRQTDCP